MRRVTPTQPQSLRRSISRIAQYRPFGSGEVQVEFARREFILAAMHENGGTVGSLSECRQVCKTLWGLELDIDEIRGVLQRLIAAAKVEAQGATYRLSPEGQKELAGRVRDSSETEAEAFAEWEVGIRDVQPDLSNEEVSLLREDLDAWLQRIIAQHGVEAAMLLYPEEERGQRLLADIQALGFSFLPERGEALAAIRPKALYAFIHAPSAAQRAYLANLMTTAYMVAVFTLDPEAHELVRSLTRGQRLYVDTNVIYSILSLNGPRAYLSARRVLQATRQLGYEVCVTPWTVTEMKESVRRARRKLAKTKLPPRALAEIAAEASGEETFITAYWRKYKDTGVGAKDFLDLHEQIEPLLEKVGIAVRDEGVIAVERSDEAIAEQVSLLEKITGGADKARPLQEHDVKHRLLVERLRGDGNRSFSNAGYWFLTRDTILVPYGATGKGSGTIPFCVSLTAWAHIVRSLCPRTEDYEQTLVDLLDTPSVRPRGVVSSATVADVLGRIDLLVGDSTEEIAMRMVLDGAVMDKIEAHEGNQREQVIDLAVEEKKNEIERQLRESRDETAQERAAREAAEARVEEAATDLEKERAARAEAEARAADATANRENDQRTGAAAIAEANERARQDQTQRDDLAARVGRQERVTRWLIAGLIALAGAAAIAVPTGAKWVTGGWPLVGNIIVSGAIFIAAIAWALGRRKAGAAVGGIAAIIGIVAGLQQIVASNEDRSNPPAPRQPR